MRGVGIAMAGALALLGLALPLAGADVAAILRPTTDFSEPEPFERNPGGATTHKKAPNRNAFSHPAANLSLEERADFFIGNGLFRRLWVTAPSSTQSADGLGPLYNARSCQRCHLKDGRGHPPAGPDDSAVSMFLRLSVPAANGEAAQALTARRQSVAPEPTYGAQLQDLAIAGHQPEGRMVITYEEVPVALEGGESVRLRMPSYQVADLGYGPMQPDVMLSPRVAPPMIGLGLLEAIAEDDLLAHADPDDRDGDGISGRPNRVWSEEHDRPMLGRFGWKAGAPTLLQQSGSALAGDIGVSNPLAPLAWGECTEAEAACRAAPNGNSAQYEDLEAPREVMDKILFYVRHLAVPARRALYDAETLLGKELFYQAGCIAC
ncbi:MAG: di-heme oxidoredictase family protein, partial [Geminicoccales bacterium]